jgi:hypothetical protein
VESKKHQGIKIFFEVIIMFRFFTVNFSRQNKIKEIIYECYYSGFREILMGFYFFVIAFALLCIYSLSFNKFLLLLLNPMHYYHNIGNKVYMLYPFVWTGWDFILLGTLELIIELIAAFFHLSADLQTKLYEKSLPIYFIPLVVSFFISSSWSDIYLYFASVCYSFEWLMIFTLFLRAHTK